MSATPDLPAMSTLPTEPVLPTPQPARADGIAGLGSVTGTPRRWLRLEGLAVLLAGAALYVAAGGPLLLLVPLVLAVDVSMAGYLAGPRTGAFVYNVAHSQAIALLVLGAGATTGFAPLLLAGAVLAVHTGMDRLAGYGLKYPTSFGDTHLGRLGKEREGKQ